MANLDEAIKKQKAKNRMLQKRGEPQQVYTLIKDDETHDEPPKGEPAGICKKCGKEFEQVFSRDRNAYSRWKICPECRKKKAERQEKKLTKEEREVSVASLPYKPFEWQVEAAEAFETHRFIALSCGNRSGKDRFSMMTGIKYFVECLNENRALDAPDMVPPVLWWIVAPTEKMAKQNWRELKQFFPKEWIVACSDSSFQMETIGGGVVEVRSGYSSSDLVGVGLDLIVLTEAARFQDLGLAWANLEARLNSPGRGRKKDRAGNRYGQGKAILNSSPLGKNAFYDIWCYGQKDHPNYSSLWWSVQLPWTANPFNDELAKSIVHTKYGDMTYEESLRRQLGERTFRSNYLADFLADDGSVFKNFEENCVINPLDGEEKVSRSELKKIVEEWRAVKPFANYVCGYDPATGSSGDSPALIVRCVDDNHIVRAFDMYGKNYEQQWDFIEKVAKYYNHAPVHWLRTGHTAIEGQLEKRGLETVSIDEQAQNKGKLVQTLELAVENGDLKVLNDGSSEIVTLIYQMNDYTEKNGKYANSKQPHDDFVSAMYAAFSNYSVEEVIIEYSSMMAGVMRAEDFE